MSGEYFWKVIRMLTHINFRSGTLLNTARSPCSSLLEYSSRLIICV